MKATTALITFILFFIFAANAEFAVSVGITNFSFTVSADSFNLNVSVFGVSSGINYIRVDFYKEGTSNYFGDTFNGGDGIAVLIRNNIFL